MREISVAQFSGPLDLLLSLIEERELDITEIALADVTEQYLAYLESAADSIGLEELTEFLVVAAKLLLIKSKALLPYTTPDEDEEIERFARQLKLYRQFVEASKVVSALVLANRSTFVRQQSPVLIERSFLPPKSISVDKIQRVYADILAAIPPPPPPLQRVRIDKRVTIASRLANLREMLTQRASIRFSHITNLAQSRTEIIVSFLALLELAKQRQVTITQDERFGEIEVVAIADMFGSEVI